MRLVEFLARCLAARKMSLIKDKRGIRLPDELWMQALPDAEFVLETIQQHGRTPMSNDAGGFIDIAPDMLAKLREAARKEAGKNTYTWIAPGHVLALLDTIDELEAAIANATAKLIRLNLETMTQNEP